MMLRTWLLTVWVATLIRAAISLFPNPSAIRSITSRSRSQTERAWYLTRRSTAVRFLPNIRVAIPPSRFLSSQRTRSDVLHRVDRRRHHRRLRRQHSREQAGGRAPEKPLPRRHRSRARGVAVPGIRPFACYGQQSRQYSGVGRRRDRRARRLSRPAEFSGPRVASGARLPHHADAGAQRRGHAAAFLLLLSCHSPPAKYPARSCASPFISSCHTCGMRSGLYLLPAII